MIKYQSMLIDAAVKNLKEFGYPKCNSKNIFTDAIYRAFFVSMLKDNLGHSGEVDEAINSLIAKANKMADQQEIIRARGN